MKIEKISFGAIATKLSRAEMKKIMAGSGESGGDSPKIKACAGKSANSECHYTDNTGYEQSGKCTSYIAGPLFCSTLL